MKYTIKIFATILLVLVLTLSISMMVGCGDNTEDPATTPTAADRGNAVNSGTSPDGTTWTVYQNGELAITGTPADGVMYDYNKNLAVPAWKAYAEEITGLSLDDSIKTISADAFSSMKSLVWIKFSAGTETIGENAFRSCSNLRRLVLPEGVKTIGENAFNGCYRLWEAELSDTIEKIGNGAFAGCNSLLTVRFPKGDVEVASGAFADSSKLVQVITENGAVKAGADTFGGVAKNATTAGVHGPDEESILTNTEGFLIDGNRLMGYIGSETALTIPEGVIKIGANAFYANTAVKSIDLGDKVIAIDSNAFGSCTGLETITIGKKINNIAAGAFNGCTGLKTVNWNFTATQYVIAEGVFDGCTALTTINFGTGCTLPTSAGLFRNCTALESVTLPAVQKIPAGMFEGCTALKSVTLDAKNKEIGEGAFRNCTALTDIDFTKMATSSTLSAFAFEGCSSLVTIDLTKVSKVKEGAFNYCKALTGVVIGTDYRTDYGTQAFDGCTKLIDVVNNCGDVVIKPGGTDNGGVAKYTTFDIGKGASRLKKTADGYLFFEAADANYLVGYVGTETALTLPASYNSKAYRVYANAFSNNKSIAGVKVGAGVTAFGEGVFRNCTSLVNVDFTGSVVKVIPAYAFDGCTKLETVTLSDAITEIGEAAFRKTSAFGKMDLKNVETLGVRAFQYSGVTELTATGAKLTALPNDAFSGCARLTRVDLSKVKTIGNQAFANCVALTALSIPAAETIGEYAFYHNTVLTVVNIPACVTIGQGAFQECGGLMSLTLGTKLAVISESAFKDCGKLVYILNNSTMELKVGEMGPGYVTRNAVVVASAANSILKTEGDYTYMVNGGKTYLLAYTGKDTVITLPAKLGGNAYDINRFAFWGSHVTEVTVPEGVTVIGVSAFAYSALEKISLPASLRTLQDSAFEGSALREITMKEGITTIGDACFKYCRELQKCTIPNSVTKLGMSAFRECVSLRNIVVGTGITKIPDFAFDGCVSLAQIKVPSNATYGKRWYWGCYKLVEVWTPSGSNLGMNLKLHDGTGIISVNTSKSESRTNVDENGFVFFTNNGVNYLVGYEGTETNLVLPTKSPEGGTYQIYDYAFYNRDDIETIRIPERVTGIGRYAFAECDNLKGVYLPATLTGDFGVGENLFWGCSRSLVVATGIASADSLPEKWDAEFHVQGPASAYRVAYGVTYDLFLTMIH